MLSVLVILALMALVLAIASAIGKAPLWTAVFLLAVIELLRAAPLGR